MAQSIYGRPGFCYGYSHLSRPIGGLDGTAEWPVLWAMLFDMNGLRVIDLGCGFGWFCRWARKQGAPWVLGLDVSEMILARANSTPTDSAITYERADLERRSLPDAASSSPIAR
jgi:2-polyprenyl-3-methyl-5-hydroxy-6-metoxy-1,4-benzoquinol methylase